MARRNVIRDESDDSIIAMGTSHRRSTGGRAPPHARDSDTNLDDDSPVRRRGRGRPTNAERERRRLFEQQQSNSGNGSRGAGMRASRRMIAEDDVSMDGDEDEGRNGR